MKRQKRDRLERAQSQGYKAGLNGRSMEACPYQQMDAKSYWLGGWRDARDDKQSGLFK
ncbi:ribosome modulation factor [Vibrio maritimus]|jgi:ribosome modulation factor|uniref:Ribosome modulation factor n=4 Tax=Vibrio TaxID=662 RepID=A0A090T5E0_9VIBR|nr:MULTISPECIES: ribosome modulation factor [Vibrio]USD61898.1 ribosome modulation factor [Vibrio sp. SCSIO 43140]GAL21258.1 ribosome modulation factor [Vibrio maritimus]GAL30987.1 ribosome modulation factor [Vibrio variabilis]GAL34428.1 ribosome modulation factor [Vibrio maritimus]